MSCEIFSEFSFVFVLLFFSRILFARRFNFFLISALFLNLNNSIFLLDKPEIVNNNPPFELNSKSMI